MRPYFTEKYGLEIGGPSRIFGANHLIPVYHQCRGIDACNFAADNIWRDAHNAEDFGVPCGREFIAEAASLTQIPNETYDFVITSHVLEHIANPLRAVCEWKRVLRPGGVLLVVVPHKLGTFDRKREFTTIEHLDADFQADTQEGDLTHLHEVLTHHDLALDPAAGSSAAFRERCLKNALLRAMHHHVFSPEVLVLMFDRLRMRVLSLATERPFHIIGFAQKEYFDGDTTPNNLRLLSESAAWRSRDSFNARTTLRETLQFRSKCIPNQPQNCLRA